MIALCFCLNLILLESLMIRLAVRATHFARMLKSCQEHLNCISSVKFSETTNLFESRDPDFYKNSASCHNGRFLWRRIEICCEIK